jgi:hypothetical protein
VVITMQHEVAANYHGCSKCKKLNYPYYWGDDRHFYCEDCVKELVKEKKAEYGRHSVKVPFPNRPKAEPPECEVCGIPHKYGWTKHEPKASPSLEDAAREVVNREMPLLHLRNKSHVASLMASFARQQRRDERKQAVGEMLRRVEEECNKAGFSIRGRFRIVTAVAKEMLDEK